MADSYTALWRADPVWSAACHAWSPAGWWSFGPAASWPRRG